MDTEKKPKVGCVIVTYNPNASLLQKNLDAVSGQVDALFVSDNSTSPSAEAAALFDSLSGSRSATYHKMGGNLGIAAAQNAGIGNLLDLGCDYIFFLDQDSTVPPGMVESLVEAAGRLRLDGVKLGAIGPRPFNRGENRDYRGTVVKGTRLSDSITAIPEIISSASLVPASVFADAGMMDASLFIDYVDFEWCWRAAAKGYRFFILESVRLSHQVGEGDRKFLGRKIPIATPFRLYYQVRNFFLLAPRRYVPAYWKLARACKVAFFAFYYPLAVRPRAEYLRRFWWGIGSGIAGVLRSKAPENNSTTL